MATIEKKAWPEQFEEIVSGRKKFELRIGDFEVSEGDTIILKEYDPEKEEYSGRSITKRVSYVLEFKPDELPFYAKGDVQKHGLQIIQLE